MIEATDTEGQAQEADVAPAASSRSETRADSAEEVVVRVLVPGEKVELFVECLRRQKTRLFEKAVIALTNGRLLLVSQAFPWGFELHDDYARTTTWVVNGKERVDGSRLMVLRHNGGTICLYFTRHQRDEAEALLEAVGIAPKDGPPPFQANDPALIALNEAEASLPVVVHTESVDPVEMAQEFQGLMSIEDDEPDDSF